MTLILIAATLLIAGLVLVSGLLDGTSPQASVPPPGTVIDAANGQVAKRVVRGTHQPVQIGGGRIFRACNLSTETSCGYPLNQGAIQAHDGDIINFKFRLHHPGPAPMPYATFHVLLWSGSQADVEAELNVKWPKPNRAGSGSPLSIDRVLIDLPMIAGLSGLAYIPGSTMLLDQNSQVLGQLPDGIMDNGIALANIGSPVSCFACDLKFVRFVTFQARVDLTE